MSPIVFIFGCVALGSALVFATVCAYKLGKYQGWREALRHYNEGPPMYSTYPRLHAYRPVSHLWETWQDWLPESRSTEYLQSRH